MNDTLSIEKIIVDEHLYLSPPEEKDIPAYVEYFKEKVFHDTTGAIPYPYTEENGEAFIKLAKEKNSRFHHPIMFGIRNEYGGLIGGIGFHGDSKWGNHAQEIGYWLGKPYWKNGIMAKVLKRFCQYGFDELGLVRITAHIFKGNDASAILVERCGFVREGFLRKCILKNGEHIDANLYALIK